MPTFNPLHSAGNKIGADITGMNAIPNGCGGSPSAGIFLGGYGNLVGSNFDGVTQLGNGCSGLFLSGSNNIIGGTGPGEGNFIAHNGTVSASYSGI